MRKTLPNISYRKTQTTLEKVEREQYKMRFLYQRHPRSMENIDQRGQGKEDDGESGARLHSQLGCFRMSSTFGKIVPAAPRPPATPSLRRAYSNTMKASKRRKHTKIGIDPKRTSTSIARPCMDLRARRRIRHLTLWVQLQAHLHRATRRTPLPTSQDLCAVQKDEEDTENHCHEWIHSWHNKLKLVVDYSIGSGTGRTKEV